MKRKISTKAKIVMALRKHDRATFPRITTFHEKADAIIKALGLKP